MNTPIPIFFDQLLISMNFFQHVKNQAFSSFRSRDVIYLKILQSHWPKTFWQDSKRSQYFSKHTAININFHYKPNSKKKLNFHTYSKNLRYGLFSPFLEKIFFQQIQLCQHHITLFWVPEKNEEPIPRKFSERSTDLIYRTLFIGRGSNKREIQLRHCGS